MFFSSTWVRQSVKKGNKTTYFGHLLVDIFGLLFANGRMLVIHVAIVTLIAVVALAFAFLLGIRSSYIPKQVLYLAIITRNLDGILCLARVFSTRSDFECVLGTLQGLRNNIFFCEF